MNTITKTLVLVTGLGLGLAAAGSLLAYGPGPGYGYKGGSAMMQGGHGGPGMMGGGRGGMAGRGCGGMFQERGNAGFGPAARWGDNPEETLAEMKTAIGIGAEQESAWNAFSETLTTHIASAKEMHETRWAQRGTGPNAEHLALRQQMWEQRQKVQEAAAELRGALDPEQLQKADTLFGQGCFN